MKTITVNGYTGHETEEELIGLYQRKLAAIRDDIRTGRLTEEGGTAQFRTWLDHHFSSSGAAKYHNAIAEPAARLAQLRRIASLRVRDTDDAYDALEKRTTTAWHAAHHRYVLAATAAHTALTDLIDVASELLHAFAGTDLRHVSRAKYEEMVPAADRAMPELPNLTDIRAELDSFVQTQRARFAITAHTLTGTTPAGFEPTPDPEPETQPEDHDDDQDDDEDYSARWRGANQPSTSAIRFFQHT